MPPAAVVRVEELAKRYGRIEALRGVSLAVQPGEIFGLLGGNGAGKTTFIKILVGSCRPSQGHVRVLGLNPLAQARALRRQIGYMPQMTALYEDLSPRDNIRFFGRVHGPAAGDQRVERVIDFIGLRRRACDPVYELSGGMKRRVSLACALVHEPRLLLLDEPTAGVDPVLRQTFWRHFRELALAGATVLISTHQMDEALFCDRLAILRDGQLLGCDSPRNLLRSGLATIRVWRGDQVETSEVADYAVKLPHLLQRHNLDPSVTRIQVEEETLETVVLRLIREDEP